MSEILNLIKDLRERTGAGFLDCKNALTESKNNIDNAIVLLRKKVYQELLKNQKEKQMKV